MKRKNIFGLINLIVHIFIGVKKEKNKQKNNSKGVKK